MAYEYDANDGGGVDGGGDDEFGRVHMPKVTAAAIQVLGAVLTTMVVENDGFLTATRGISID